MGADAAIAGPQGPRLLPPGGHFSWGAVDGWPELDPDHLDDVPLVTITLADVDGGTQMTLRVDLADHLTEEQVRDWLDTGMAVGWAMTIDRLAPDLEG